MSPFILLFEKKYEKRKKKKKKKYLKQLKTQCEKLR